MQPVMICDRYLSVSHHSPVRRAWRPCGWVSSAVWRPRSRRSGSWPRRRTSSVVWSSTAPESVEQERAQALASSAELSQTEQEWRHKETMLGRSPTLCPEASRDVFDKVSHISPLEKSFSVHLVLIRALSETDHCDCDLSTELGVLNIKHTAALPL